METRAQSKVKRPKKGTRDEVVSSRSLLAILLQHPKGLSPEALFAQAGYRESELTDVYSFYRELRLLKPRLRQKVSKKPADYRHWSTKPIVLLEVSKKG
jgi:hypothetical protein